VQRTFRASIVLQWILPADDLIAAAVEAARGADLVLVCVSDIESEGIDRENLSLPGQQNQLITALVAEHPHSTVVVANVGGPVTMPWLPQIRTVLIAWYAGQQDGAALARVLAGDVDPGGRLPVTFGRHESDYPARMAESYPGVDFVEHYREGAFIGYRHFDAHHIEPMFCFGHGLSYTSFRYERFHVTKHDDHGSIELRVQVTVVNTGDRAGDEVVQLYLGQPDHGAPTPRQVLRKFARVHLRRGERKTVEMNLTAHDLSRWGVHHHHWYIPPGSYRIAVGSSSRHIRASSTVTIPRELPGVG
jgi:beta-glucosidase